MLPSRNIILVSSIFALIRIGSLVTSFPAHYHYNKSNDDVDNSSNGRQGNDDGHAAVDADDSQVLASMEILYTGTPQDVPNQASKLQETFHDASASPRSISTTPQTTQSPSSVTPPTESTLSPRSSDWSLALASDTLSFTAAESFSASSTSSDLYDGTTNLGDSTIGPFPSDRRAMASKIQLFTVTTETVETTVDETGSSLESQNGSTGTTERGSSYLSLNTEKNPMFTTAVSKKLPLVVETPNAIETENTESKNGLGITNPPANIVELTNPLVSVAETTSPLGNVVEKNSQSANVVEITSPQTNVVEITNPPANLLHLAVSESSLIRDPLSNTTGVTTKYPQTVTDGSLIPPANNSQPSTDDSQAEILINAVARAFPDTTNARISDAMSPEKKRSVQDFVREPDFEGARGGSNIYSDNMEHRYRPPVSTFHGASKPLQENLPGAENSRRLQWNSEIPHPLFDKRLKPYTSDSDGLPLDEDGLEFDVKRVNADLDEDVYNYEHVGLREPTVNVQPLPTTFDGEEAEPAQILRTNPKLGGTAINLPPAHQGGSAVRGVTVGSKVTMVNVNHLPTRVVPLVRSISPLPIVVEKVDPKNSMENNGFPLYDDSLGDDHHHITADPMIKPLPTRIIPLVRPTSPLPLDNKAARLPNSNVDQPFIPNLRDSDPFPLETTTSLNRSSDENRNIPTGVGNPADNRWDSSSVRVKTPVGEMGSRAAGLMMLILMVVSSVLLMGIVTVAAYWIKAKLEVRRLDREMRTACVQGLDNGFADHGL